MNAKVLPPISEYRCNSRRLRVAKSLPLIAAMLASSALFASAQIDSTGSMSEETPAPQQFVSTNQLLTPEKAQRAAKNAREAFLRGRYEEAQKHVTYALEICPNCATALTLQGALKLQEKEYAEAAQLFRQAINADATLGAAYLGLGQSYNMLGRFKEALVPLTRVAAIFPAAWAPHFEKARAHLGVQEPEAALEEITRAERTKGIDRQRRSALLYLRAHAYLQRNHYPDAITALQEAVKQYPKGDVATLAKRTLDRLGAHSSYGR